MKRFLTGCLSILALLASTRAVNADDLQLTLDLRNNNHANGLGGGTWQLFARVVETAVGPDGSTGIVGIRALLDRIDATGITFNPAINSNGAASVQTLPGDSEGTVQIVYRQDLAQPTLPEVGVPPARFPNRDVLIATGSWPVGPARPRFGTDGTFLSSGEFLALGGTSAVIAESVSTSVFTLGDFNGSNTITNLDINAFVHSLPGGDPFVPYNPAADINQSGHISNLDISPFIAILSGPTVVAVREASAIGSLAAGVFSLVILSVRRLEMRRL